MSHYVTLRLAQSNGFVLSKSQAQPHISPFTQGLTLPQKLALKLAEDSDCSWQDYPACLSVVLH